MAHFESNEVELPEIFPKTDVVVENEEHTFKVSELEFGTEAQYEYTLNKAPIGAIQSVQGTDQDGNTRTFSNGADYELTEKTDTVQNEFTYLQSTDDYLLRYQYDNQTDIVSDESGNTYVNGTDYRIIDESHYYGDVLEWLEDGNSPQNNEQFTVVYDVTFPSSVLQWQQDANNLPKAGSIFYVTYRADSIISRYLDAHEDQLDKVDEALERAINNKFVDSADGESLDELGKLFGPTIGKRRGRTDEQYRIYLKSAVQSFVSRGTVNGIKLAISAATDVPIDDIEINEDFENVEYEVLVQAATPVTVELLEEVAEVADPSGVNQIRTRFLTDPDDTVIDDFASFTEGLQAKDSAQVDDFAQSTRGEASDELQMDDATLVNPNKFATPIEEVQADDANAVNENKYLSSDAFSVDDAANVSNNSATDVTGTADVIENVEPVNKNSHRWEETDDPDVTTEWSFFEWTEIVDLLEEVGDVAGSDDAVAIPPKDAITSDTTFTDDVVTIPATDGVTTDTGYSNDAVTNVSQTLVAWNTRDWDSLEWTIEHN